jgi:hypothetical protein
MTYGNFVFLVCVTVTLGKWKLIKWMSTPPLRQAQQIKAQRSDLKLRRYSFMELELIVLQWNAVALWAWDIVVDNCAICRNHTMDLCNWRISVNNVFV